MSRELCARLTDLVLYIDSGNPYTTLHTAQCVRHTYIQLVVSGSVRKLCKI